MDMNVKEKFLALWPKYFPGAQWPIVFYYTDAPGGVELKPPPRGHSCMIGELSRVRQGQPLCYRKDSLGCAGGRRYLGFSQEIMPNFEFFLSCGIPGQLEGERYKKSPELVRELMEKAPQFTAPAPYLIFKRWDQLEASDNPEVVIFFAPPDVLAGLFTLANFEEADPYGVISPFAAGCGTDRAVSLPGRPPGAPPGGFGDIRCLGPAVRAGGDPLLRRSHGQIPRDARRHGGKLPDHRFLGEGQSAPGKKSVIEANQRQRGRKRFFMNLSDFWCIN